MMEGEPPATQWDRCHRLATAAAFAGRTVPERAQFWPSFFDDCYDRP